MTKRGFISIIIVLLALALLAIGGWVLYAGHSKQIASPSISTATSQEVSIVFPKNWVVIQIAATSTSSIVFPDKNVSGTFTLESVDDVMDFGSGRELEGTIDHGEIFNLIETDSTCDWGLVINNDGKNNQYYRVELDFQPGVDSSWTPSSALENTYNTYCDELDTALHHAVLR